MKQITSQADPKAALALVALGAAFGAAFDDIGLGVALGTAFGIVIGACLDNQAKNPES